MDTILVVEDEGLIAELLEDVLQDAGYRVVTAGNGLEGLARLADVAPDLVLSDIMMPGLDGRALCQRIRSDARYHGLPIVLMSAALPAADRATDYTAFIRKPFDLDGLLGTIRRILDAAGSADAG